MYTHQIREHWGYKNKYCKFFLEIKTEKKGTTNGISTHNLLVIRPILTPMFSDLIRATTLNLNQVRSNILPQTFLTGCFYKSLFKPKILAKTKPWLPWLPWQSCNMSVYIKIVSKTLVKYDQFLSIYQHWQDIFIYFSHINFS